MKKLTILLSTIIFSTILFGQDFNTIITQTADSLSKKILATGKKKIAITDFINIDESITQLGRFLSSEVSSELANLTQNQTKFRVLERANLDQIFKEKNLINFSNPTGLAKELGKLDVADVFIFATITDFDGYYRVVLKLLDTRNGDALSSYKINFVKTPSLENMNKITVKNAKQFSGDANKSNQVSNDENKGDYCFKNKIKRNSISPYSASVTITKVGESKVIKTISIATEETSCVYQLNPGVYTVTITWKYGDDVQKKDYKEIKITAGEPGLLELDY